MPPEIVQSPLNTIGRVNSDVELGCSVRGSPKPTVQWIKDGDIIPRSDYFQVAEEFNLHILGLVAADAGMYQCLATNDVGSAQSTAQLIVRPSGEL